MGMLDMTTNNALLKNFVDSCHNHVFNISQSDWATDFSQVNFKVARVIYGVISFNMSV